MEVSKGLTVPRGLHPPWKPQGLVNLIMENTNICSERVNKSLTSKYSLRECIFHSKDMLELAETFDLAFGDQHGSWDTTRIAQVLREDSTVKKTFVIDFHDESTGISSVIACGSVRIREDKYPGKGYPHWIAVHPAHQGQGLAISIMNALHREFREGWGLTESVLETQDVNLPAIATYLKLGYQPVITDKLIEERWNDVYSKLGKSRT